MDSPAERCDIAVVGGGILGLALARELILADPGRSVCVLEREDRLAAHQSSHNSGVIHAGVYYAPGSLKARLCVEGARAMYEFCEANAIAHQRCGKLIVATGPEQLARLDDLYARAQANGVEVFRVAGGAIAEFEPHARGLAALHSPATGIVDYEAVTRALATEFQRAGGVVATGCEVGGAEVHGRRLRLRHSRGVLETGHAIFCAGAWSDRLAAGAGAPGDPRIVPFRGSYLKLRAERRELVQALIYPVPDPRLPFLGVHLTRRINGDVLIGPTALLALSQRTLSWPGTWRLARAHWRAGLGEIRHALSRRALVAAAAQFVAGLSINDVEWAFVGERAQALGRDGALVDDFSFSVTPRALHVRNAPSPAATASLAIARHVAAEARRAFA